MADPLIIKALQDKRAEVHGRINAYQAQIAEAKHDLAHINAAIRLFTDEEGQRVRYPCIDLLVLTPTRLYPKLN